LYYFKRRDIRLGRNVVIHGLPLDITIGEKTSFYDNCIFEFGPKSHVAIGKHVLLSYGVVFCCTKEILIGDYVQIGEYSSLRDTTHSYEGLDTPMKFQPDRSQGISIADDVWIGRGCLILPGTEIESGVVVGANSVVKGKLEKNGIYAGTPAKLIKMREEIKR
jgi:acetyltransferase-like isoleucine patch superfamily enzyme